MAITFKDINLYDSLQSVRETINSNFQTTKIFLDTLNSTFKVDDGLIPSLNGITISSSDPNSIDFNSNSSGNFKGNLVVGQSFTAKTATINEDLTVLKNLILSSSTTNLNINGSLNIGGAFCLSDIGTNDGIVTSSKDFYSKLNYTMQLSMNYGVGFVPTPNRNSLLIDWTDYNPSDSVNIINTIMLESPSTDTNGQILEIVVKLPENSTDSFYIDKSSLEYPDRPTSTKGIKFTKSYQTVSLISYDKNWVVLSTNGATFE
jgi:hypothetical protein